MIPKLAIVQSFWAVQHATLHVTHAAATTDLHAIVKGIHAALRTSPYVHLHRLQTIRAKADAEDKLLIVGATIHQDLPKAVNFMATVAAITPNTADDYELSFLIASLIYF